MESDTFFQVRHIPQSLTHFYKKSHLGECIFNKLLHIIAPCRGRTFKIRTADSQFQISFQINLYV